MKIFTYKLPDCFEIRHFFPAWMIFSLLELYLDHHLVDYLIANCVCYHGRMH